MNLCVNGNGIVNHMKINAYYSPNQNEIVFLAAILQPPFFDPKADPAVNLARLAW